MKKRRIFLALLTALALSCVLAACGKDGYYTGEWTDVNTVYGTQGFQNEPNADMDIDGYLDEAVWNTGTVFTHTEAGVTIAVRSFYDASGMYFGMTSSDGSVVYTQPYGLEKQTNSGFVLSILSEGDVDRINRFSVGFDAKNTPRAYGLYNYRSFTTVQGEVNSGRTQGMTTEVFVPWENIALDVTDEADVPDTIRVAVRYNVVAGQGSSGTWIYPGLSNDTNYGKFYVFDADGYADPDEPQYLLGDAADGYAKSADFDYSRADEGIYGSHNSDDRSIKPNYKNIFLRNAYAENFVFTVKIVPDLVNGSAALGGESAPAAYIIGQSSYGMQGFGIDLKAASVAADAIRIRENSYVSRIWTTTADASAVTVEGHGYDVSDGVPLTLIKEGGVYYYVLGTPEDGRLVGYTDNVIHAGSACPGLLTFNAAVDFTNIRYRAYGTGDADQAAFDAVFDALGIRRVTATATGGGRVTVDPLAVTDGGSVDVTFTAAGGAYEMAHFYVNDADVIADVRENAANGVYTIDNVTEDLDVRVEYAGADTSAVTMNFTTSDGGRYDLVTVYAEHETDKSKYYTFMTSNTSLPVTLPKGAYNLRIEAGGYLTTFAQTDASADGTLDVPLTKAAFGGTVTVNGRTLTSASDWDLSDNYLDTIYRPMTSPQNNTVWMAEAASGDFTLTADFTVTDATDPDPNGAFMISDGSTNYAIFMLHNGVRIINTTDDKGWQQRTFSSFSSGIGGRLNGNTVTITLSRTDGVFTFRAECGGAVMEKELTGLTYNWNLSGIESFSLPTGEVAVGFAAATGAAVTYSDIVFTH